MYRIVLLLLLPAILVILYMEGQKYDPALIDFRSSSVPSTPDLLPDEIGEYSRVGPVRIFTKENLYEYVNGHAEYFVSAGFENLSVGEYIGKVEKRNTPEIIVDVYDLGRSIQAFGVLADEAGSNPMEPTVGAMSFVSQQGLSFIAGKYYVRVSAYEKTVPLLEFARKIEAEIGEKTDLASLFSGFPDLGPPVATRFIREAYRGLDFVGNVIEREYSLGGNRVEIFLVEGDKKMIDGLTASFLDFFLESEIRYQVLEEAGRQYYEIDDPYEGVWFLVPRDNDMVGIYGSGDLDIVKRLMENYGGDTATSGN